MPAPTSDAAGIEMAIDVDGLDKVYGDSHVVRGVSFQVRPGEIVGVLGPNGAGKTTTVECISGLRTPSAGRIRVWGMDPAKDSARLRQILGVQLQQTALPDGMTVKQAVKLFASFYPDPIDAMELLRRLDLGSRTHARYDQLSGGQRQRLAVALALIGRPRVAILDELTTGLDPEARRKVWSLLEDLRQDGTTILLVSHFMEEVERLCDRVVMLQGGQVVSDDTPDQMIAGLAVGHRLVFVPSREIDIRDVAAIPSAASAQLLDGGEVEVTGSDDLLLDVVGWLTHHDVRPLDLRMHRPSLDDAYLALVHAGKDNS